MSRSHAVIPITYEHVVKDTEANTWVEKKQIGIVATTDLLDLMEEMRRIQGEIRE